MDPVWYFYIFWFPEYLKHARNFDMAAIGKYSWIPFAVAGAGQHRGRHGFRASCCDAAVAVTVARKIAGHVFRRVDGLRHPRRAGAARLGSPSRWFR